MIALLLAGAAATAQPVCIRMQPVAGFEGWGHGAGSTLAIGKEATLPLKPATGVHFEPALLRPAKAGTYGGYFPITASRAGRYRFALSSDAWMNLVDHGKRLKTAAHSHGPACSGIAKIVEYDLKPGRYWVQLSEAKEPTIGAMVSSR
ncbi:hypothetical protein [Sphingomonas crusticola]|uniref:hypothetical protein n=1 Tax=Sphingomonas crusticola TaxID=1697973 RepID=UPI000E267EAB|nr:hypothetical protein [Sphingomonas crusticola]